MNEKVPGWNQVLKIRYLKGPGMGGTGTERIQVWARAGSRHLEGPGKGGVQVFKDPRIGRIQVWVSVLLESFQCSSRYTT